jgi:hypothetical protein
MIESIQTAKKIISIKLTIFILLVEVDYAKGRTINIFDLRYASSNTRPKDFKNPASGYQNDLEIFEQKKWAI